ncbi:MAG TPA: SDR family oxidoreductase [Candidatus Caldiarchaeum subterraneum]|uniref:SDR family oxidoreductase n=1 Tax=Caldiarchaeum subterraneum TaxID=311458 RepID=A0A833ED56_CALS0|nr:SDR family oxidoreductase [Aigarchaeota archaeon]HIQ30485.1 SDR family oxidoreductase [Candidatus Caldarchaeum subterraneum]
MGLVEGKVCIVTGASGEIGSATVRELVKEGGIVYAGARRFDKLRRLEEELNNVRGKLFTNPLDVTDEKSISQFIDKVIKDKARVDCLVNIAGYPMDEQIWNKHLHQLREEEITRIFNVDFMGSFRCVTKVLPSMMKQKNGVIINISSNPAIAGHDKGAAYTFAKTALIGLTKHITREYGRYGIRAYSLALGNIKTHPTVRSLTKEEFDKLAGESPMLRWGEPAEVAAVIAFLCSDKASFINGQTIIIDGGAVLV